MNHAEIIRQQRATRACIICRFAFYILGGRERDMPPFVCDGCRERMRL